MTFDNGLDPDDWDAFTKYLGQFVEAEFKELGDSLKSSVWRPLSADAQTYLADARLPDIGLPLEQVVSDFREHIRPYRAGNTHSRFFGWVQGTGTIPALMADFAANAMNSNCGGREHSAIYVERQVMEWCRQIFGFTEGAGGVLTSGTSASTHLAMQLAIYRKVGIQRKKTGLFGMQKPLRCYTSNEGHSSIIKAVHATGIGTDNLIIVPATQKHQLDVQKLEAQIRQDIDDGFEPFLVVGNAGTVNTGAFDDFGAVKAICQKYACWLHVDGAFGSWMKIAGEPYSHLANSIQEADSLAFDFHKLMYVQYDCGALLVQDGNFQRDVFTVRPNYIAQNGREMAGGDPWFCDFGLELSRSFRALKVWFTLKTYGLEKLGQAIRLNCELCADLAEKLNQSTYFETLDAPVSNIVTFKIRDEEDPKKNNAVCEEIAARLQRSGDAVFSLTRFKNLRVLRASITNHRTRQADIDHVLGCLDALAAELMA